VVACAGLERKSWILDIDHNSGFYVSQGDPKVQVRYISSIIKMVLKVGWHREHFLSPLLQLHAAKGGFEVRYRYLAPSAV
jgi:hypothetical protein